MAPKRSKWSKDRQRAPIDTGDQCVFLQNESGERVSVEQGLRIWSGFLKPEKRTGDSVPGDDLTSEEEPTITTEKPELKSEPMSKEKTGNAASEKWPFVPLRSRDFRFGTSKVVFTPPFDCGEVIPLRVENNSRQHVLLRATLTSEERSVLLRAYGRYVFRQVRSNQVQLPDGTCQRLGKLILEHAPDGSTDGGPVYFPLAPGQSHSVTVYVKQDRSSLWRYPENGRDAVKIEVVSARPDITALQRMGLSATWPFETAALKHKDSLLVHHTKLYYAYVQGTVVHKDKHIWLGKLEHRSATPKSAAGTDKSKDKIRPPSPANVSAALY